MSSNRTHQSFIVRLNYLLFDRIDATERDLRKFHLGSQMFFVGAMLYALFLSVLGNVPVLGYFALTSIIFAFVLLVVFCFIKKVKYLVLTKELGLEVIVFYFTYHTGGLLTCGGLRNNFV